MGFFKFNNAPAADNNDGAANSQSNSEASTERKPVMLILNDETVSVSAEDAEGKTVGELFEQFGDELGDVERINRFVAAGQIIEANDAVVLGTVYRGAITSETKGLA